MTQRTEAQYAEVERARRDAQTDTVLVIEAVLTEQQRAQILAATAAPGTGLHGAAVADVLDIYADHDAHLEWTEPFYDNLPDDFYAAIGYDPDAEVPSGYTSALDHYMHGIVLSRAVLACAILVQAVPDRETVQTLAVKALEHRKS